MYMFCPPTTSAFVGAMWTEVISVKLNIDWLIDWLTPTLALFHLHCISCREQILYKKEQFNGKYNSKNISS